MTEVNCSFTACEWLFATDVTLSWACAPYLFLNSERAKKVDDQRYQQSLIG